MQKKKQNRKLVKIIKKFLQKGFPFNQEALRFTESTLGMKSIEEIITAVKEDPYCNGLIDLIIYPDFDIMCKVEKCLHGRKIPSEDIE